MIRLHTLAALVGLALATGCAGSGSGSSAPAPNVLPSQSNALANGSVNFLVPIKGTNKHIALERGKVKPQYVSAGTAAMSLLVDGVLALDDFQFPAVLPASGGFTLTNGQSGTYSFAVGTSTNLGYYVVTIAFTLIPGPHTIGVVLQDTPANNNFVLSEGQAAYTLVPGANNAATLYLEGVMDSGFWCDANCDGTPLESPLADGSWDLSVFVSDENGYSLFSQVGNNGNAVSFDNGSSYSMQECDTITGSPTSLPEGCSGNAGIVQLTACGTGEALALDPVPADCAVNGDIGPFTYPGKYQSFSQGVGNAAGYIGGELVNIKCLTPGTTTVAMVANPANASTGSVTGFNYTGTNYPRPGQVLGPIPAAGGEFGNTPAVNCSAGLTLTIQ